MSENWIEWVSAYTEPAWGEREVKLSDMDTFCKGSDPFRDGSLKLILLDKTNKKRFRNFIKECLAEGMIEIDNVGKLSIIPLANTKKAKICYSNEKCSSRFLYSTSEYPVAFIDTGYPPWVEINVKWGMPNKRIMDSVNTLVFFKNKFGGEIYGIEIPNDLYAQAGMTGPTIRGREKEWNEYRKEIELDIQIIK